jgi:hypothetical protein
MSGTGNDIRTRNDRREIQSSVDGRPVSSSSFQSMPISTTTLIVYMRFLVGLPRFELGTS